MVLSRNFPLRNGFFPECNISPQQENEYIMSLNTSITKLTTSNCSWWTFIKCKDGVRLSEERVGQNIYSVRAITSFEATLEEMFDVLVCNDTVSYRLFMRQLHKSDFIDGAVLHTSETVQRNNDSRETGCSSLHADNFTVKWAAFKSKTPLGRDRDFCFLDYARCIQPTNETNNNGSDSSFISEPKTLVRILESVDIPECKYQKLLFRLIWIIDIFIIGISKTITLDIS